MELWPTTSMVEKFIRQYAENYYDFAVTFLGALKLGLDGLYFIYLGHGFNG